MKVAIIGNSGSGKTTLARQLAVDSDAAILDLDTIYWEPGEAVERPAAARLRDVADFCRRHDAWIVEGCYADLIETALPFDPELIFLDPGVEACLAHCRRRPFEAHKYSDHVEQQRRLAFLLQWVAAYDHRDGPMSRAAHEALFARYQGPKRRLTQPVAA